MSECGDAMSNCRNRVSMLMRVWGVLQGLPRMFVSSQVILLSLLVGDTMGVRCAVV